MERKCVRCEALELLLEECAAALKQVREERLISPSPLHQLVSGTIHRCDAAKSYDTMTSRGDVPRGTFPTKGK